MPLAVGTELSAFALLEKRTFDGAMIDYALHNEAFELCDELRALNIPYVCCNAPHKEARRAAARAAVDKLARITLESGEVARDRVWQPVGLKSGWQSGAHH